MPSTEISSTCLLTGAGTCAAAFAEPCNADSVDAAAAALAARHAKVFRLVTGTPDRADLFGAPVFLSSQGEIRVLVRKTTHELIEATCRFLATSREFGATSTNHPPSRRGGDRLLRHLDNSLVACHQRDVTPPGGPARPASRLSRSLLRPALAWARPDGIRGRIRDSLRDGDSADFA